MGIWPLVWKDATSYSQGGDRIPRWWKTGTAELQVLIGDWHVNYPDGGVWLMHCYPWFDTFKLKATNLEDAKVEAVALVEEKLLKALRFLEGGE